MVVTPILLVLLFMSANSEPTTVSLWWVREYRIPLYWLIFGSATAGGIVLTTIGKIRRVIGEVKRVRREERLRRQLVDQMQAESAAGKPPSDQQGKNPPPGGG